MKHRLILALSGAALIPAASASAQVGTGWMEYDPPSTIHLDGTNGIETSPGTSTNVMNGGASFTNMGGIETFTLFNPISNRSERRMQNTYLTGRRQFEGEVRVSPPTDDESVMQVFGGNSGATTQMIRAYNVNGGTLRKVPGSVVLAENIHGTWVKVNVIHDVGGNFVRTYINGRMITMGDGEATNAGSDGWYHKYGCYGTLRTGMAKVEWRNVKHFRDGTSPTATDGGPPADASAAADSARPADARAGAEAGTGAGGSGGAGGAGGAAGSGPSPAPDASRPPVPTGGTGGTEEPPTQPPPARGKSGGCSVGSAGGAGLLPVLLALLALRRRRTRSDRK
jgi:MYXO-CTERM domain-containing protein